MIRILIFFLLIIWLIFFSKKTILKKILYLLLVIILFPFAMCMRYHKEEIFSLNHNYELIEYEEIKYVVMSSNYLKFGLNTNNIDNLILKEIKIYYNNSIIKILNPNLKFSEMEIREIKKNNDKSEILEHIVSYYFKKDFLKFLSEIELKNKDIQDRFYFEIILKNIKNNKEFKILLPNIHIFYTSKGFELFVPNI